MFAVFAAVVFFLMAIHVALGSLGMLWLALMFLALHLAYTVAIPFVGKRQP